MQGYRIVSNISDRKTKVALGEDVFQASPYSGKFLTHEFNLSVREQAPLVLFYDDIESTIAVLQKAKERAEERAAQFEREEALAATA